MNADAVMRELAGLRALARSLVAGDADADDLLQDAAVAAIEHPPVVDDRPVRGWLATVLRNRRRMDRRAAARRQAREDALAPLTDADAEAPDATLDRARVLERLSAALVALDEPFRSTVMRRYLDGQTAAEIARAHGVPAGTVRWRLKTGLERLRVALDDSSPRWRAALAPLALPGAIVKTKVSLAAIVIALVLLLGIGALVRWAVGRDDAPPAVPAVATGQRAQPAIPAPSRSGAVAIEQPVKDPLPGQGRATVEIVELAGGAVSGRVINWSTGDGVENAELTFMGASGATTVRSGKQGVFELAASTPGKLSLTAIAAAGFLPFAPELLHSTVHVELTKDRAVRGITVFLFPAVDYHGKVVDKAGAPVAGAKVRLLGTPAGEQVIDKLETEWTTDKQGQFTFHAADDAVFEAVRGTARGWARLDGGVAITHQLTITIDAVPPRDATITGRVVDATGAPLDDVLVRALPPEIGQPKDAPPHATAFATTDGDGRFTLENLDRVPYEIAAQLEGYAPVRRDDVLGGTKNLTLTLDPGQVIAGAVETTDGAAVPAYTLLVTRRRGTASELALARSVIDARGRFEVRVAPGDYELVAAASGWAPSAPVHATGGDTSVRLVVTTGATLRGTVVAAEGGTPLGLARVMREAGRGGASAQPANAGTVTREDGTFELTGIPPGPLSITIGAGGYHPKIEAGLTATDGATLGPLTIALTKLAPGEQPTLELVGIGVKLAAHDDALRVEMVIAGSGAEAAGIVAGDEIVAVDGVDAVKLGVEGAVAKIRGVAGTTVSVTLRRPGGLVPLVVERRKLRA